jgi:hypothetical protein
MAQMAPMFAAIGNGAQAALGTSALSGASSAAAGAGAAGAGAAGAGAAGAGAGSGMFGSLMSGAGFGSANQAGGTIGTLLGQSLMNPSQAPQASAPQGDSMANLFSGMAEKAGLSPKEWATPKFDTNSYINKLLSGVR